VRYEGEHERMLLVRSIGGVCRIRAARFPGSSLGSARRFAVANPSPTSCRPVHMRDYVMRLKRL